MTEITPETAAAILRKKQACAAAANWLQSCESLDEAWSACARGDWMLWLIGLCSGGPQSDSRKRLVATACACARLALKYLPDGEDRPLAAITVAEAWSRGEDSATLKSVSDAAVACMRDAACAADAAFSAACAAGETATATLGADTATCAQVAAYPYGSMFSKYTEIVRNEYPTLPDCVLATIKHL